MNHDLVLTLEKTIFEKGIYYGIGLVLTTIDSVMINGTWRRRFCYCDSLVICNIIHDTLVEGIGNLASFSGEGGNNLTMFCKNDIPQYQTAAGNYCYLPVSTHTIHEDEQTLYFSENNLFCSLVNSNVTIYNMLGEKIISQIVDNTRHINCSSLPPGIYIAVLKNTHGIRKLKFQKE